jgi:hypothetical protein
MASLCMRKAQFRLLLAVRMKSKEVENEVANKNGLIINLINRTANSNGRNLTCLFWREVSFLSD